MLLKVENGDDYDNLQWTNTKEWDDEDDVEDTKFRGFCHLQKQGKNMLIGINAGAQGNVYAYTIYAC